MAIIRAAHERDFTIITNAALRDTNLSLKAKGLLALMLSEHDGWNFTIKGFSVKCKEGVDAVAAIIKELEAQGYVMRRRERSTANGKARAKKYHGSQNHRHQTLRKKTLTVHPSYPSRIR